MAVRIQLRRGTSAEWTSTNPVLAEGESGLETDTGNVKYGDGVRPWAELPYSVAVPGPGEVIVGTEDGPVADGRLFGTHTVADGTFEWWIHPTATYLSQPYPRTVFGALTSDGKVWAGEINHLSASSEKVMVGEAIRDDHCPPALWIEEGRRPVMAWTKHDADTFIYLKIGGRSGSIASLGAAPLVTVNLGGRSSYTQLHKIAHLSDDTQDTLWCFTRRDTYGWAMIPLTVNQATGAVTAGPRQDIVRTAAMQSYVATADAFAPTGNQVIRLSWGYNPAQPRNEVYYFEIDTVTGEITSPQNPELEANMEGTGLPIADTDVTPALDEPPAGHRRHMFAVRPGPDSPAVGYAEWNAATPDDVDYYVWEPGSGKPRGLAMNGGHVTTPFKESFNHAGGLIFETVFQTPDVQPSSFVELARRYTVETGGWRFMLRPDKQIEPYVKLAAGTSATLTGVLPFEWGDTIGYRYTLNLDPPQVTLEWCANPLDASPVWTQLTSFAISAGHTVFPTTFPIHIPGLITGIPRVYSMRYAKPDGTLLAGFNVHDGDWDAGAATFTDSAGNVWTANGGAAVDEANARTFIGKAGPRFGYHAGNGYFAGVAFETPSEARAVIRASSVGGVDGVYRMLPSGPQTGAPYVTQVLREQPTSEGRLVRPYAPVNGGPLKALATNMTSYAPDNYIDYEGDIVTMGSGSSA